MSEQASAVKELHPIEHPVELGTLPQGEVKKTFAMVNDFDQSIKITKIHTSCSCTVAEKQSIDVAAGETTEIPFTWNTSGERGHTAVEIVFHYLVSGEKRIRYQYVTLSGDIEPLYDVTPSRLRFQSNKSQVLKVRVSRRHSEGKLTITSYSSNHPSITVGRVADSELEVIFESSSWFPASGFDPYVSVVVDVPSEPLFKIPVHVESLP